MRDLFACMLGIREIIRLCNGTDVNQTGVRFFFADGCCCFFFLERKEEFEKAMKKNSGCMRDFFKRGQS